MASVRSDDGPRLSDRLYSWRVEHLAPILARIPGVVAVALGGSRASGLAIAGSDWDFGLYYRGRIDTDAIRALGYPGGEWALSEKGIVGRAGFEEAATVLGNLEPDQLRQAVTQMRHILRLED